MYYIYKYALSIRRIISEHMMQISVTTFKDHEMKALT